jgi:hypothetical protein
MRKTCAKPVYLVRTGYGKLTNLTTRWVELVSSAVYDTRFCAQLSAQLVLVTVHKIYSLFTPVNFVFIPTVHNPYNKQQQITEERIY